MKPTTTRALAVDSLSEVVTALQTISVHTSRVAVEPAVSSTFTLTERSTSGPNTHSVPLQLLRSAPPETVRTSPLETLIV